MTATGGKKGFIDQYFGGDYVVEMKCTESEEEPATKSTETFYQMSCFIEKGKKIIDMIFSVDYHFQLYRKTVVLIS